MVAIIWTTLQAQGKCKKKNKRVDELKKMLIYERNKTPRLILIVLTNLCDKVGDNEQ